MRWLGMYFDYKLSFADHANEVASKGQKAATGLTMLVKTTSGVNAMTNVNHGNSEHVNLH